MIKIQPSEQCFFIGNILKLRKEHLHFITWGNITVFFQLSMDCKAYVRISEIYKRVNCFQPFFTWYWFINKPPTKQAVWPKLYPCHKPKDKLWMIRLWNYILWTMLLDRQKPKSVPIFYKAMYRNVSLPAYEM